MKLKVYFVAVIVAMMTTSAFAQFFSANPTVTVLPFQVRAEVYNPFYEPIICNGQVFGQTAQGPVYNAFFAEQLMPVGSSRIAVVVTNGFNPFLGGWANIHCRFARW